MIKRALISVSDKTGIVALAEELFAMGVEILSTGGTAEILRRAGIPVIEVSEATGFPECLDGRVKTLHPVIHGGILAVRDKEEHMATLKEHQIPVIDLVVINLYPFKETIQRDTVTLEEAIENIDIGGPAMLRSAAKNHKFVTVITDPRDYSEVVSELKKKGEIGYETRYRLALKVFQHTSHYDALIAAYLSKDMQEEFPQLLTLTYEKQQDLRYGENPHQKAALYREIAAGAGGIVGAIQLQGKELSFNNINDANGAIALLKEFEAPTVVAVKHTNPCGVATADNIFDAYTKAYNADPLSIFGGIVAANAVIDEATAEKMAEIFLEVIIAPEFTREAIDIFSKKKNLRLIELKTIKGKKLKDYDIKNVIGGILVQQQDEALIEEISQVTMIKPTEDELKDLIFALKVVKHVKSNGIVIAKNQQTLAIGPGQTSRIWALKNAIGNCTHQLEGSVLASDAFFPFDDCVREAAKAGIKAIIQPGGSVKDEDSIRACDEVGIGMVFSGIRHFKH